MNPTHRRRFSSRLLIIAMLALLLLPAVGAQDDDDSSANERTGIGAPPVENTPEATEPVVEIVPTVESIVGGTTVDSFIDNFDSLEALNSAWSLAGWQVSNDGSNSYLMANSAGASATVSNFIQEHFQLSATMSIDPNNVGEIVLRSGLSGEYRVVLGNNGSSRLYKGSELVASFNMPVSPALVVPGATNWFVLEITSANNSIAVIVNGQPSITYTDVNPLGAGIITFRTGGSNTGRVFLDNLSLNKVDADSVIIAQAPTPTPIPPRTVLGTAPNVERFPTPLPSSLPERHQTDVVDSLANALSQYAGDNETQILAMLAAQGFDINARNEVFIKVDALADSDTAALGTAIEGLGASVYASGDSYLEIFASVSALQGLSSVANIESIDKPDTAFGSVDNNTFAQSGTVSTIGYDTISAHDWHSKSVTGAGVRVGVIATGFEGDVTGTDYACLVERVGSTGLGTSGLNTVQVLCDLAPSVELFTFSALSYAGLFDAIVDARNYNVDVLVIALDLGVTASSGDGLGAPTGNNPYTALSEARDAGIVVLAAAGDNGVSQLGGSRPARYVSFEMPAAVNTTVTLNISGSAADRLRISWNDWNGIIGSALPQNLEDFDIKLFEADGTTLVDIDRNPYTPSRTSFEDAPVLSLNLPALDTSSCAVNGSGVSACNLVLSITRKKGDGPVIFQVQLVAEQFINRFTTPQIIEKQALNVQFTDVAGATLLNTGTLARPADSPDVIAVGAVCANESANFALLPDSSTGPVFGPNGTAPTVTAPLTQGNTKPQIVSAAQVATTLSPLSTTNPDDCDGTATGSELAGGFYGTSSAVAHAGGMAALLRSNTSMRGQFTESRIGVVAVLNYMQGHSVELPLTTPNGFDMTYGAGMSILGSPEFSLINAYNPLLTPDLLRSCPMADTVFVGQGKLNSTQDGSFANPYIHIADGMARASTLASNNGRRFCVVVFPGEYVTPIYSDARTVRVFSYNEVTSINFPSSIIRVAGQYILGTHQSPDGYDTTLGTGGVNRPTFLAHAGVILDATQNVVLDGFNFSVSSTLTTGLKSRQPILLNRTQTTTIRNSAFGAIQIDGVNYAGMKIGQNPITVIGGFGNVIEANLFQGNIGGFGGLNNRQWTSPTVLFLDGGSTSPMVFRNNLIQGNTSIANGNEVQFWPTLLYALNTDIDIVGNVFIDNQTGTAVTVVTKSFDTADKARIFSNIFQNNRINVSGGQSGPIVHAYFVPNLSFINNNVVKNNLSTSNEFSAVVARGDRVSTVVSNSIDGSLIGSTQIIDFTNNLIFSNTMASNSLAGIYGDPSIKSGTSIAFNTCNSLAGGTNQAMRNNWIHSSGALGGCATSINTVANGNDTTNPSGQFVGTVANLDPLDDVEYYALNFFDLVNYSRGMDYSNLGGRDVTLGTFPFDVDAKGDVRVVDVESWERNSTTDTSTFLFDVGAFEFDELDIIDENFKIAAFEDAEVISIDMRDVVRGGIGGLTYEILEPPLNYGTQCGASFANPAHLGIDVTSRANFILYCPPPDFYTSTTNPNIPQNVTFRFEAADQGGLSIAGIIPIELAPDSLNVQTGPDAALTEAIGDDVPLGDVFSVIADIGSSVNIKLRPYVDFNNFFFSEANNPQFIVDGRYMIEYPFVYSLGTPEGDAGILEDITLAGNTLQVTLSENFTGEVLIPYTVTDSLNNSVTNYLKVRSISSIPVNPGIYDDASVAFEYFNQARTNNGNWQLISSETSINNTLHTSEFAGDVATFGFRGTGFTLYMQGSTRGGFWNLFIDPPATNPQAVTGWTLANGVYSATSNGFTCVTTAIAPNDTDVNTLTGKVTGSYTITCESTVNDVHVVEIRNNTGAQLNIDAFSIVADTDGSPLGPITPGFYEVLQPQVRRIMTNGWTLTANRRYTAGLAYAAFGNASPISFTTTGGSGFAIGTVLDSSTGTYRVCVTDITPAVGTNLATCLNYNNTPVATQRFTPNAFQSFYGLEPSRTYRVDINNVAGKAGTGIVIDSLVVFQPTLEPAQMVSSNVEADELGYFVLGGGLEDTWDLDTNDPRGSNRTVMELKRLVPAVGPFTAFRIDAEATHFYYSFMTLRASTQVMVCVDRALGVNVLVNDAGANCIRVNLQTGQYSQITSTGGLGATGNVQITEGTIGVSEANFRRTWAGTRFHTVEVFSIVDESFTMDGLAAVNSAGIMGEGRYEEYVASLRYLKADGTTNATVNRSTSIRAADYTGDFTQVYGRGTLRDANGGLMYAGTVGGIISFNIEGTGFAPNFRLQRAGGAMEVCWLAFVGTPATANTVLNTGTCRTFDTESLRTLYNTPFRVLGLPFGTYSVAMKHVGDDFDPTANRFGQELYFDGLNVYNDNVVDDDLNNPDDIALRQLLTDVTYEGSYLNRVNDKYFAYFGDGWSSVVGSTAANYSNRDYDVIRLGAAGAMVAFRVTNANAIVLTRDLRRGYANFIICAVNEQDATQHYCSTISNDGSGFMNQITVRLSENDIVGNYFVTILSQTEAQFNFDAVKPIVAGGLLLAGRYNDNDPAIHYSQTGTNLVLNGDMERNSGIYWTRVVGGTGAQSTTQRFTGRSSWLVNTTAAGHGIQSLPFNLQGGSDYTALARFFVNSSSGVLRLRVVNAGQTILPEFTEVTTNATGRWVTIRSSFSLPAGTSYNDARVQIVSSGGASFYVDDVHLANNSNWQTAVALNRYLDNTAMASKSHGAIASFLFSGTGFAIGMPTDRTAGQVQICYLAYSAIVPTNGEVMQNGMCMGYENETRILNTETMRVIAGLAPSNYKVVIRDNEDGNTINGRTFPSARGFREAVGSVVIDWIEIFGENPPEVSTAGVFNENANISGRPALQLLPVREWGRFTGSEASTYSNGTFAALIDENRRVGRNGSGGTAVLNLSIPAGQAATVILDVKEGVRTASDQLLACAGGMEGDIVFTGAGFNVTDTNGAKNCVIRNVLQTSRFITYDKTNLPFLANSTGATVNRMLVIQTTGIGTFQIDGYQVLYGAALDPGFFEDSISSAIMTFNSGTWTSEANGLYSNGTAIISQDATSSLSFQFRGSGISIVTAYRANGGRLEVNVTDGGAINSTQVLDTKRSLTEYGTAVTIAGLPYDPANPVTYTVTLTSLNDSGESTLIDAISVYNELPKLGSLYDDAQIDADGQALFEYGPSADSWETLSGTHALNSLNETLHVATTRGATASFEVGASVDKLARGIGLYYNARGTASAVEVCFRDAANPANQVCQTVTVNDGLGRKDVFADFDNDGSADFGNYYVTVMNLDPEGDFYLDAVQVLESDLTEGIHNAATLSSVGTLGGNASLTSDTILLSGSGDYVEADATGIGLSFILANASADQRYQICVSAKGQGGTCDVLDSEGMSAITTLMGLHDSTGNNRGMTVRFTNTGTTAIALKELHVLGDNDTLVIRADGRYENDAPQLRYLPFGSYSEVENKVGGASQFSQHISSVPSAVAYFEFTELADNTHTGFEYIRELSGSYGDVEVCYAQIGSVDAQCETVSNSADSETFQVSQTFETELGFCAEGCWATVRNLTSTPSSLDSVGIFAIGSALQAGYYEETNSSLSFTNPNSVAGATWGNVSQTRASGGTTKRITISNGATLTNYNGPMLTYLMNGTGTTVYFTADRFADAVRICVLPYTGSETEADVLSDGYCQSFDNEDRILRNKVGRTVAGLPAGSYVVIVQMQADNERPVAHDSRNLPLYMDVDAVQVYGNNTANWQNLQTMTPGRRYEGNFPNRADLNEFVYYGAGWTIVEGSRARTSSNADYDTSRETGSGVTFRVSGGDAVVVYTDLRRTFSPIRICATPLNSDATAIADNIRCRDYSLDGLGSQQGIVFHLTDFGRTPRSNYAVTVSVLTDAFFNLDAVEVIDTGILKPGFYEGNNPNIIYPSGYQDFIVNGSMNQNAVWSRVGSSTISQSSSAAYGLGFGYTVNGALNTGIQSGRFELVQAGLYTIQARVRFSGGSIRVKLVEGGNTTSISEFTEVTQTSTGGAWRTIRASFVLPSGVSYRGYNNVLNDGLALQVVSNSGTVNLAIDEVELVYGGEWTNTGSPRYTNNNTILSTSTGAAVSFAFEGSGFQLGMGVDRNGGEAQVCYDDDALFDEASETGTAQSCFTYQNESLRSEYDISRTVAGLPYGIYYVRIYDVENGLTVTNRLDANAQRNSRSLLGQIGLDYVRIFDEIARPVVPSGYYNEDVVNANGDNYLQLSPSEGWTKVAGPLAARYTERSYYMGLDSNGRANRSAVGQAATLFVNVPSNGATIMFYTGRPSRINSNAVLVCAGNSTNGIVTYNGTFNLNTSGTAADCVLKSTTDNRQIIVSPSELTGLATEGVTRVQIMALNSGIFTLDGYQVIEGNVLSPGIYDNTLPDSLLDFDTTGQELPSAARDCNVDTRWCEKKNPRAFGETIYSTQQVDGKLTFNIEGTGFSIVTPVGFGVDMRICYQRTPLSGATPIFPTRAQTMDANRNFIWNNASQNLDTTGVWCDLATTNTSSRITKTWEMRTPDLLNPVRGDMYGFSYYGLPNGRYTVQVSMVDTSLTSTSRDALDIDAIVVFGDRRRLEVLPAGLYDDSNPAFSYEPSISWTETTGLFGPARGPLNGTEHSTLSAGAIMQMRVDGNALTFFQTMDTRNSRDVRLCMLVRGLTIHCTFESATTAQQVVQQETAPESLPAYALAVEIASFSQSGRRAYFVPVLFYGLGEGEHEVIIENRDHNRPMSFDALLIHD